MRHVQILFSLLFLLIASQNFAQTRVTDQRTGIPIIFSADGKIFPDSWYSARIDAKGESLDKSEYERSREVVQRALLKYPVSVVQENLKAVYVLHRIEFFGSSFGGTNSSDVVYLSNRGKSKGYNDFYLEQLFHAEFSSILLRNKPNLFSESLWKNCNAQGFKYGKGGVAALKKGSDSEHFDEKLNRMGVINQYSVSSLENDFNAFAKNLFLPEEGFAQLLETYPLLRKKRNLLIEFYLQIHAAFTKEFFDKILDPRKD